MLAKERERERERLMVVPFAVAMPWALSAVARGIWAATRLLPASQGALACIKGDLATLSTSQALPRPH